MVYKDGCLADLEGSGNWRGAQLPGWPLARVKERGLARSAWPGLPREGGVADGRR